MAILKLKNETTKEWEDVVTIKGDKGDKPTHEIDGTKIRFQNPDGTWGEWVELEVLTAEQVPTNDGSNVQNKLNNSFSLGNDSYGSPYIQNEFGVIMLDGIDPKMIERSGEYYLMNGIDLPQGYTQGYLSVYIYSSGYKLLRFIHRDVDTIHHLRCKNGIWNTVGWTLVEGAVTLYSTTISNQTESSVIPLNDDIRNYSKLRFYLYSSGGGMIGTIEGIYDRISTFISAEGIARSNISTSTKGMVDVTVHTDGTFKSLTVDIARLLIVTRSTNAVGTANNGQVYIRRIDGIA